MSSLSISQQSSSQQVSSSVQKTSISSRRVREVDSSSRLALGSESDYEAGSRLALGGATSSFGIGGAMAGYEGDAFRADPEEGPGGKSRSQRLKDIMADAESEMDAMLTRSRDARNAAERRLDDCKYQDPMYHEGEEDYIEPQHYSNGLSAEVEEYPEHNHAGARFADDDYNFHGQDAAGSGHSNAGDDIVLPGRNSSLGQDDPEPKSEMERRINLRSKALQRGLPKYV